MGLPRVSTVARFCGGLHRPCRRAGQFGALGSRCTGVNVGSAAMP